MAPPVEMIVPRDADPGLRVCSEAWAACLREGGFDVTTADVTSEASAATAVIIAPHAALRPLADDPLRIAGLLRRAVCVSTSRLGSGALGADRAFHSAASGSVALSRDAARYLTAHGTATAHLKPGAHARLRSPRAEARAVSVGAHARHSSFRGELLARSRAVLDPFACDLRISHSAEDSPPGHLEPPDWLPWLTSVDVLVSLPAEPGPGTDWCEVAPAVLNGAVVMTTAESDYGPLDPGEDVATATSAGFADSLRRLLADGERRERMRASAQASLSETPLDVTPLAEAILAVATNGRRARPFAPGSAPPVEDGGTAVPDTAAALGAAEEARARRAAALTGAADRTTSTSAWQGASPAVSVVIPSYDQGLYVGAAVESALAAVGVELEIVVIDDGSADASAETVRGLLAANDGRALKLVEHAGNAGLAEARNRGFLESRAPLILLLDADDLLLPHGPAALFGALESDPEAAFAYGFVARCGLGQEGLLGTEAWDPALFRHGNYVPVTGSLVRRSAWEVVGGFSAEGLLELGWEDMDFWLRLAEAGRYGIQVRRIVGAYRVHGNSRSTVANRHAAAIEQFMRERYPGLMGADDS